MEATRGTAYGLALSQLMLTLGAVLFFPPVASDLFVGTPFLNGTTHMPPPAALVPHVFRLYIGLPLLASSGLVVLFSTTTMGLSEQGVMGMDYCPEALEQAGMWDALFWAYALLSHLLVTVVLMTPADAYASVLSVLLSLYFLRRGCAPRSRELNITQENLSMLGYFAGVGLAAYNIPASEVSSSRLTCLFFLVLLDYFLALGHTWDRQATLDTVTNCRLFYACAASLGLAGLCAAGVELLGV